MVKINAQRTPSEVFNLFQAQLDGANVTTIRGDRLLQHKGDVHVLGGLEVQQAGAGVGSAVITNVSLL